MEHTDIGAELITRLMNDNESQLRFLLRTRSEPECPFAEPPMECKPQNLRLQCPRAAKLADLMTKFFNEIIEEIGRPGFSEERISDKCWQLGATHYHKEVWFQEENWMHFHKAFVEAVMFSDKHYQGVICYFSGYSSCDDFFEFKKKHNFTLHRDAHHCIKRIKYEEILWFKLIHFIVRNMKQGFLEEAIHSSIKGVPEVEKNIIPSPRHVTSKDTLLSDGLREDEDSRTESCLESDLRRKYAARAAAGL
uniref:Uncharacterized protein n=1 Tax=Ascaris lumbricoides TaxID=6252 RepID=A0A9J2Q943_ASCLU